LGASRRTSGTHGSHQSANAQNLHHALRGEQTFAPDFGTLQTADSIEAIKSAPFVTITG
jgi:hypothetical protein